MSSGTSPTSWVDVRRQLFIVPDKHLQTVLVSKISDKHLETKKIKTVNATLRNGSADQHLETIFAFMAILMHITSRQKLRNVSKCCPRGTLRLLSIGHGRCPEREKSRPCKKKTAELTIYNIYTQ